MSALVYCPANKWVYWRTVGEPPCAERRTARGYNSLNGNAVTPAPKGSLTSPECTT